MATGKNYFGGFSFIIGLILAIGLGVGLSGIKAYEVTSIWVLFIIGILVGWLNITDKEIKDFLVAGTVLTLISYLGITLGLFDKVQILTNILKSINILFVSATIVVALRAAYQLAKR